MIAEKSRSLRGLFDKKKANHDGDKKEKKKRGEEGGGGGKVTTKLKNVLKWVFSKRSKKHKKYRSPELTVEGSY